MTPLQLTERLALYVRERPGDRDHPLILWALELCGLPEAHDETPWCGALLMLVAVLCGLTRPARPARARSWLTVGQPIALADAVPGYDVVVLSRGIEPQPGPDVLDAPGHIGLFVRRVGPDLPDPEVFIRGGNQSNRITVEGFASRRVLGVRRLGEAA